MLQKYKNSYKTGLSSERETWIPWLRRGSIKSLTLLKNSYLFTKGLLFVSSTCHTQCASPGLAPFWRPPLCSTTPLCLRRWWHRCILCHFWPLHNFPPVINHNNAGGAYEYEACHLNQSRPYPSPAERRPKHMNGYGFWILEWVPSISPSSTLYLSDRWERFPHARQTQTLTKAWWEVFLCSPFSSKQKEIHRGDFSWNKWQKGCRTRWGMVACSCIGAVCGLG